MSGVSSRPLVLKEIRALLPIWIASAAAIVAVALSASRHHGWGWLAYVFGSVTLGSQSIGHEYTDHMLTSLLSQPRSRRHLLLVKFAVLTVMLFTLAALAWVTPVAADDRRWLWLTVLNALCLAPLVTMVCRTPVAGVVFTGALPFWLEAIAEYLPVGVLQGGAVVVFAAGAFAEWRMFMRLEAIDGRGAELELPRFSGAAAAAPAGAPGHPLWQVAKKELHLQQMTFAVAAVWLVIWTTVSLLARALPWFEMFPLAAVSLLYGALLAMLIGVLASAGERQLGTLDWQSLQPVAAWQQWIVKMAAVIALAALMSFLLPVLFAGGQFAFGGTYAAAILMLTIGSLYVSSLCRNTIRALTIAAPAMLGLSMVTTYLGGIYTMTHRGASFFVLAFVPLSGVAALMLWFSFQNHRSAEPGAGRVSRQVLWMAACAAAGVAAAVAIR